MDDRLLVSFKLFSNASCKSELLAFLIDTQVDVNKSTLGVRTHIRGSQRRFLSKHIKKSEVIRYRFTFFQ